MKFPHSLRALGAALLVAAIPVAGSAAARSSQANPLFGHNLIVNGDAEAGPGAMNDATFISPPGWKTPGLPGTHALTVASYTGSGLDLSPTTPGPKNRGKNYFYGGPTESRNASAEQTINVASAAIDAGTVTFTLSGWLGGYSSQSDNARLSVTFKGAQGKVVGYAAIGPVTPGMRHDTTELLYQQITKHVPFGTRTVVIDLFMKWYDGSDNDGMADNLSLVLATHPSQS
jgi:hypothetical protein